MAKNAWQQLQGAPGTGRQAPTWAGQGGASGLYGSPLTSVQNYNPYVGQIWSSSYDPGAYSSGTRQNDLQMLGEGWSIISARELPSLQGEDVYQQWPHNDPNYVYVRATGVGGPPTGGEGEGGEGEGEGGYGEAPQIDIEAMMQAALAYGKEASLWSWAQAKQAYPKIGSMAQKQAGSAASYIDQAYQGALADVGLTAEDIMPGIKKALSIAQEYEGGNIPEDVQAQILRTQAGQNIAQGREGPIADFNQARQLGLTSMQLQQYGMQVYPQLAGQAIQLGQSFIPGTMNLPQFYSQGMQQLTGLYANTMLNPNAFPQLVGSAYGQNLQAGTQMAGYQNAYDIASLQANTQMQLAQQEMAYSNYWNQINQMQSQYQQQLQYMTYQQQQEAASRNSLTTGLLSLGGAIVGSFAGPLGSAIGGSIGGYLGSASSGGGYEGTWAGANQWQPTSYFRNY